MIDLHTHSNCSDGDLSPEELIEFAHRIGCNYRKSLPRRGIGTPKSACRCCGQC